MELSFQIRNYQYLTLRRWYTTDMKKVLYHIVQKGAGALVHIHEDLDQYEFADAISTISQTLNELGLEYLKHREWFLHDVELQAKILAVVKKGHTQDQ